MGNIDLLGNFIIKDKFNKKIFSENACSFIHSIIINIFTINELKKDKIKEEFNDKQNMFWIYLKIILFTI